MRSTLLWNVHNSLRFHSTIFRALRICSPVGTRDLEFEDGKIQLTQRLLDVMEARSQEANSDDFSRMAWLALHLSHQDKAQEFAVRGLEIDPENVYCRRIVSNLGVDA